MNEEIKEVYIVGPTASGKSSLAIGVAMEYEGEIVCADSQTLRKHLDIGTAKPSKYEQEMVRHYMLDIIEPFAEFSVAEFKRMARKIIDDIKSRGKLPIIVGGSGMYIDSLYFDYDIGEQQTTYTKDQLEAKNVSQLQEIIKNNGWPMPENKKNPRHLMGVILRGGAVFDNRNVEQKGKLIVGLLPKDDVLKSRIKERIEKMLEEGLVSEVKHLQETYGSIPPRMDAIGYPLVQRYLQGDISLEEIKKEFTRSHWQYARKQKAWFKRNPQIRWFDDKNEAVLFIEERLNKNK